MSQIINKFLAQMPTNTIKGNNTGSTANPTDLTVAQVNAILPVFTSSLNGLTPLSGGGTTNFLRADGSWAAPTASFSGLTTNGVIYATSSSAIASTTAGTSGFVLTSNGSGSAPTFQPAPGTVSAFFASSQVSTDSSFITSGTFINFDNSPAFTFTPTISGTYKVYCSFPAVTNSNSGFGMSRIFNTSANATLLYETHGGTFVGAPGTAEGSSNFVQSVYTLNAGTSYIFDIQGSSTGANIAAFGFTIGQFYMFAELEVTGGSGSGGIVRSVNSISTATTGGAASATDYVYLVTGTTTFTLPTAVGNTNLYTIKNVGSNTVSIATTSSQTIDGSASATLSVANTALSLISNGSNWNVV